MLQNRRIRSLARWSATLLLLAGISCGASEPDAPAVPPISGSTLDAIQSELAARVSLGTEGARVERQNEGRHATIHAKLTHPLDETELATACTAMREVLTRHLEAGQTVEVFFLQDGGVTDSCTAEGA